MALVLRFWGSLLETYSRAGGSIVSWRDRPATLSGCASCGQMKLVWMSVPPRGFELGELLVHFGGCPATRRDGA